MRKRRILRMCFQIRKCGRVLGGSPHESTEVLKIRGFRVRTLFSSSMYRKNLIPPRLG